MKDLSYIHIYLKKQDSRNIPQRWVREYKKGALLLHSEIKLKALVSGA